MENRIEDKKMEQQLPSTEEKIKEAARRVFTLKGYAATRTRDIAEESGHNLALLNYYFRSKEKLFDIIMMENLEFFIRDVLGIINDAGTTLEQKLELLVEHYIDMLVQNPTLPIFILNAVNTDPKGLIDKITIDSLLDQTQLAKQWKEMAAKHPLPINPLHIFLNVLSMTVFPFVASPIIKMKLGVTDDAFQQLMQERKKLIPIWVKSMLQIS